MEGLKFPCLLDSGSCVTCISESLYFYHFQDFPLQPIEDLLQRQFNLEGANGEFVKYKGYVVLSVLCPGLDVPEDFLILVTADTDFSERVPVIVGTNVFNFIRNQARRKYGVRYLQRLCLPHEWEGAVRSLGRDDAGLEVGWVKLGNEDVVLQPGCHRVVLGTMRSKHSNAFTAVTQPLAREEVLEVGSHPLHSSVDIPPVLIKADTGACRKKIPVQLRNPGTTTIRIPARTVLCQLHRVSWASSPDMLDHPLICAQSPGPSDERSRFLSMFTYDSGHLTRSQLEEVNNLLWKWRHVFSTSDTDVGYTEAEVHEINLTDETPIKERYRRIAPSMFLELKVALEELLQAGIIRPSTSPWSAPMVLVRKKDGGLRICVDYRSLNSRTICDAYALPRIDEVFDCLAGATMFSSLDLKAGYHQMAIKEEHKERTAFTAGPLGFYEYERVPMGLTNAPPSFQRLMEKTLKDILHSKCLVYLDDIVVFGRSFAEHLERLEGVLSRLADNNLKLKPSKCSLFQREIEFLGHHISESGVATSPSKVEAVKTWPTPSNLKELRSFLGFSGYYRRFIRDYAKIARPLNDLQKGTKEGKGGRFKPVEFVWGSAQQSAFEELKKQLTSSPILAFADFTLPFELEVDASETGLGAVLYQKQNGVRRIIAYASRSTNSAERSYPAHKREFLGLKWAVGEKFKEYLYGQRCTVYTDNNPLTYVFKSAKLDATGQRWLSEICNFDLELCYLAGKNNGAADALSRLPLMEALKGPGCAIQAFPESLPFAACSTEENMSPVESVSCSVVGQRNLDISLAHLHENLQIPEPLQDPGIGKMTSKMWSELQQKDACIQPIFQAKLSGVLPAYHQRKNDSRTTLCLWRQWDRLVIKNGVLFRSRKDGEHVALQMVVPAEHQKLILTSYHDQLGHVGVDRTLHALKSRFYWPSMEDSVKQHTTSCLPCIAAKTSPNKAKVAPLGTIQASRPMEVVSIDYLTMDKLVGPTPPGIPRPKTNILVVIDHFTRYAYAIETRSQKAKVVARELYEQIFSLFGFPAQLHSDQGANFCSEVVKSLCDLVHTAKSRTTAFHASGNGLVERFNSTLITMVRALPESQRHRWRMWLSSLLYIYNSTVQDTTGYSPFFLMFGRHPRLPMDVLLGLDDVENQQYLDHSEYIRALKKTLQTAYDCAVERTSERHDRDAKRLRSAKPHQLKPGDTVLVRALGAKAQSKISTPWEPYPYVVESQPDSSIPVYKVRPERGNGASRILHRDKLLPIALSTEHDDGQLVPDVVRKRAEKKPRSQLPPSDSESGSDNEDNILIFHAEHDPADETPAEADESDEDTMEGDAFDEEQEQVNDQEPGEEVDDRVDDVEEPVLECKEVPNEPDSDDTIEYDPDGVPVDDIETPGEEGEQSSDERKSGREKQQTKFYSEHGIVTHSAQLDPRMFIYPPDYHHVMKHRLKPWIEPVYYRATQV